MKVINFNETLIVKNFILLLFIFVAIGVNGQTKDSLRITIKYGADDPDLRFYMMSNNHDLFKIGLHNDCKESIKISIICKEIKEGVLIQKDTLTSWKYFPKLVLKSLDSLNLSVLTSHITKDSLRFNFEFDKGGSISYHASKLNSDLYSLRDAINSDNSQVKLPKGSSTFLVYSLPYVDPKNPNILYYCELTARGVSPENWYKEYGIKHYIIFDLMLD